MLGHEGVKRKATTILIWVELFLFQMPLTYENKNHQI